MVLLKNVSKRERERKENNAIKRQKQNRDAHITPNII